MSLPTLIADIVAVIAPVFAIAALGYGWARAKLPFDGSFVTTFMINVATPCLVFSTLARLRFEGAELATMLLASVACMALAAAIGAAVLRLFRLRLQVYLPALTFPNAGNMGMPLCLFAFGEQGLGLAVMYFSALSAVQFTLGPAIAAGKPDFWQMLRTPVIYAVALALLLRAADIEVPRWAANTTKLLGDCAVPLMLVSLGVALAKLRVAGLGRAAAVSALRLGLGFGVGLVVVCGARPRRGSPWRGAARELDAGGGVQLSLGRPLQQRAGGGGRASCWARPRCPSSPSRSCCLP